MSQQQSGPSWGSPPPEPPGRGMSRRKRIALWSAGGVVGVLVLLFIIGTVAGPAKKDKASDAVTASPSASPTVPVTVTTAATETAVPSPSPTRTTPSAAPTTKAAVKPKPKPSRTGCGPIRDVILWMKVPDLPDSAQLIGNWNQADCRSSFDTLPEESPTDEGFCTEEAWASDNPGYDVDATPAERPKKVQVAVGPAC
jgi:hypothetical protein